MTSTNIFAALCFETSFWAVYVALCVGVVSLDCSSRAYFLFEVLCVNFLSDICDYLGVQCSVCRVLIVVLGCADSVTD